MHIFDKKESQSCFYFSGFRERERECPVRSTFLRESLRERERFVKAVVETAETCSELFIVHGLRTGRQRGRQSKRRSDHHEQHGQVESAAARFLIVRVIKRIIKITLRHREIFLF